MASIEEPKRTTRRQWATPGFLVNKYPACSEALSSEPDLVAAGELPHNPSGVQLPSNFPVLSDSPGSLRSVGPDRTPAQARRKHRMQELQQPYVVEHLRHRHFDSASFYSTQQHATTLPHTGPSWIGLADRQHSSTKADTVSASNPPLYIKSSSHTDDALVDKAGVVYAWKVAKPANYEPTISGVTAALERFRSRYRFRSGERDHRRGKFAYARFGVSYGGGQTVLSNTQHNNEVIAEFRQDPWVLKHVRHAMNAWETWAPGVKRYYTDSALELSLADAILQSIFPGCPFMAATLNLGPQTILKPHRDHLNLAFGVCCVMVFGDFDFSRGGQLHLHEPGVVWEIAPGDIVFFPSAAITHSNWPISPQEHRYSFTMYSAGGLFRWTSYKGHTACSMPTAARARDEEWGPRRWEEGWRLYRRQNDM